MPGDLARRLERLESSMRPARRGLTREGLRTMLALRASIAAAYLGGWQPGAEPFAALERAVAAANPRGGVKSLDYAVMRVMYARGVRGDAHAFDGLMDAFTAIGEGRGDLFEQLQPILDRYPHLDLTGAGAERLDLAALEALPVVH